MNIPARPVLEILLCSLNPLWLLTERGGMDFIERIFHLAPDNGSGVLEAAILVAALMIPIAFAILRLSRKRSLVRGPLSRQNS